LAFSSLTGWRPNGRVDTGEPEEGEENDDKEEEEGEIVDITARSPLRP